MATDRLRKGMRFLPLLPRTLPGLPSFTAPEVLHTLCPLDLSLGTPGREQKGKGDYKRSVLIHNPSSRDTSVLCLSKASPMYFSLQRVQVLQQHLSQMKV